MTIPQRAGVETEPVRRVRQLAATIAKFGDAAHLVAYIERDRVVAALDRDFERAARYYGATETWFHETGLAHEPDDELVVAPLISEARAALGLGAFARLEAQGRALSYVDAVADVRTWLNRGC